MNDGDWNDSTASVLGMHLRDQHDEVLVWFNRRIEPVVARLPEGEWAVGLSSDDGSDVAIQDGTATLPRAASWRSCDPTDPPPWNMQRARRHRRALLLFGGSGGEAAMLFDEADDLVEAFPA